MTRKPIDARIAARHDDIPQEALLDAGDFSGGASTGAVETQRKRYVKSVGKGTCPTCRQEEVGHIRSGSDVVWRDHYRMAGRVRLRCSGSGTAVDQ